MERILVILTVIVVVAFFIVGIIASMEQVDMSSLLLQRT